MQPLKDVVNSRDHILVFGETAGTKSAFAFTMTAKIKEEDGIRCVVKGPRQRQKIHRRLPHREASRRSLALTFTVLGILA